MYKVSRIVLSILLVSLIALACEGPSGSEGPQGPEGPEGPVGPAGEDGSMMYSGEGEPGDDIGDINDYYLNQNTGELYGPKDSDGWGNPIIVLMGEDGADGQDGENGEDGADGEDGSQIYSGNGAPDASLGVEGDYYLDKDSYELYGPKTSSGWGTPLNLKGADGNANVTRYIFPSHDFSVDNSWRIPVTTYMDINSESELAQNAYLVYLKTEGVNTNYYSVPGPGLGTSPSYYRLMIYWAPNISSGSIQINLLDGSGEAYDKIEVVKIEGSNTVDHAKQKDSIIPNHLDTSNYQEVAEYFGFYK